MTARICILEIFSGAGGFSASIDRKRFQLAGAVDSDRKALAVYHNNNPSTPLIECDVGNIADFRTLVNKRCRILIAGPPCQGFSVVGMKTKRELAEKQAYDSRTDPRNTLPLEIARAAAQVKPDIVITENVPAMNGHIILHDGSEMSVTSLLRQKLEETGYYASEPFMLDSSKLGISQRRRRTFMVASLHEPVDAEYFIRAESKFFEYTGVKTVWNAIGDLEHIPTVHPGQEISATFPDHISRIPNTDDLKIIAALRQGENYSTLLKRLPEVVEGRAHKIYSTKSFHDKFYRLKWASPSRTIVAHLAKDGNSFIHPSKNRSLSVREAARIQSFPDAFRFCQKMTTAYRLIGNAVPPKMGRFVIETAAEACGLIKESK